MCALSVRVARERQKATCIPRPRGQGHATLHEQPLAQRRTGKDRNKGAKGHGKPRGDCRNFRSLQCSRSQRFGSQANSESRRTGEYYCAKRSNAGGRGDVALRDAIAAALGAAGFEAAISARGLRGEDPNNICNRGCRKEGVQLEIPKTLRDRLVANRGLRIRFAEAVRGELAHHMRDPR
ncbi:poly-gamma-glutamate hydrolase family protein [Mesorhizobium sp. M1348]|uniref:poly-gamma-glutamate hydrolase family protein n=1 Tax=Mesorhizobium sp. M1348 TaxID=2957089 RepID=UPI00333B2F46